MNHREVAKNVCHSKDLLLFLVDFRLCLSQQKTSLEPKRKLGGSGIEVIPNQINIFVLSEGKRQILPREITDTAGRAMS